MKGRTRALALSIGFAGLWGCGGGGGGGSSTSSQVVLDPNGDTVTFAAFQNGSGAWVPLNANGSGLYTAKVTDPAGRYGVAAYDSTSKELWILQATTREVSHLTLPTQATSNGSMTISGTVSGLTSPDDLGIWAVSNHQDVTGGTTYGFSTPNTQTWDAVAILGNVGTSISSAIRRSLTSSATTQNFDVTAAEFQPVVPFSVSITPASSLNRATDVEFNTANGTVVTLASTGGTTLSFGAPAVSERADGDFYDTFSQTADNGNDIRASIDVLNVDPGSQSITTPALQPAMAVNMTAGTNPLFHATWSPDPSAKIFWFGLSTADGQSGYQVYTTKGWVGSASSDSYTTPDLSQVNGWPSNLALASTVGAWQYQGTATPLSTADYFDPNSLIPDGTSFTNWNQLENPGTRFPRAASLFARVHKPSRRLRLRP